jgi:archaellum component FlaC
MDLHHHHFTRFQKKVHDAMDATTKLLLDQMKKMSDRIDTRLDSLDGRLSNLEKLDVAVGDRVKPIEQKAEEFAAWQHEVESAVTDLVAKVDSVERLASKVDAIDELKQQVSNISNKFDRVVLDRGGSAHGILPKPEAVAAPPPADNPTVGPDGHHFDNHLREHGFGFVMAYTQLPVKGTFPDPQPKYSSHRFSGSSGPAIVNTGGRWPKLPFPKFEGDNPKLWQSRCENYFDMSGVDRFNWVRIAVMYFDGHAARWLQSIENRANATSWDNFCKLVHDRFGRDQHEVLIRQLFHIRQIGSVSEYVEQFT